MGKGFFNGVTTGMRDGQNKYFIFKNANRRKSIRMTNLFFMFFIFLCYGALAVTVTWLVILAMGGLLGLFLSAEYTKLLVTPGIISLASVALYLVLYVVKFFVESVYIRNELKELNQNKEENKNHLIIAEAVNKVRKLAIIFIGVSAIFFIVGAALLLFVTPIVILISVVVAIVLFIVFRAKKFGIYTSIHDEVISVINERKELASTLR